MDSWAVKILHAENAGFASTCQTVGQKVGIFVSTSLFIALHSPEFCNRYLRTDPREDPVLSLSQFMLGWCVLQLVVTLYIGLAVKEGEEAS